MRILLAEDDPDTRELLASLLRGRGHEVKTAHDGADLLAAYDAMVGQGAAPELLVSDIEMPRCSGIEAMTQLRGRDVDAPAIFITGIDDDYVYSKAKELARLVLRKPLDVAKLFAEIRVVAGSN